MAVYRDDDLKAASTFPPPTTTPPHRSMANSFDTLVDSNLRLIRVIRIAVYLLIGLTTISVFITGWSDYRMKASHESMEAVVTAALRHCR